MLALHWFACHSPTPDVGPPEVTEITTSERLNVVLVVFDTTRADHMGFLGDSLGLTPNLDALAARSVVFSQAHSHASWTKPSTASLMTSQLPADHGVLGWFDTISDATPTLATTLHDAGYATAAVVGNKALDPEINTFHVGFDTFDTSVYTGIAHPTDLVTSDLMTDRALEAVDALSTSGAPYLLWVQYFDPHDTYFSHDEPLSLGDSSRADYAEEIAFTDREVGRLLDRVADREDTIVVFLADHGEAFGEHGLYGHGMSLYEELLHVPLLVAVPGEAPRIDPTPVGTIDVAPTLLALLGVAAPEPFEGYPLLPTPTARPLYAQESLHGPFRSVTSGGYKLIVDLDGYHLFDLLADPTETINLAGQGQPEEAELWALLVEEWPDIAGL